MRAVLNKLSKREEAKKANRPFTDEDISSAILGLDRKGLDIPIAEIPEELGAIREFLLEVSRTGSARKSGVLSPSYISYSPCSRKDFYSLMKVKPTNFHPIDEQLLLTFDVGHFWHKYIQMHLWWAGMIDVEPDVDIPEWKIYGHADGVFKPPYKRMVLEIKTMDTNLFSRLTEPMAYHVKQATIYAKGLDAEFIVFVYIDKNKGKRKMFIVPPNEDMWREIKSYSFEVQKAKRANKAPKRVCGDEFSERAMSCPYRDHCFNIK